MLSERRFVPPRDPEAEPVCLLTKEWAERRKEPVDALLASTSAQLSRADGVEYRFPLTDEIAGRIGTFISEEAECCPFLAFETFQERGEFVLRVIHPGVEG